MSGGNASYLQLGASSEHGAAVNQTDELSATPQPESWCAWVVKQVPEELSAAENDQLRLLFAGKAIRMFSFGFLAVMLFTYLSALHFAPTSIGLLFTVTLIGDASISLYLTSNADVMGRRKMLLIGAALSVATSFVFALSSSYWVLLIAATLGVISPAGSEVGPFMAIELSCISQLTRQETRTSIMAWCNLTSSFANAAGAAVCGFLLTALSSLVSSEVSSFRIVMLVYALLQCAKLLCFLRLNSEIEVPEGTLAKTKASPVALFMGLHKSKNIVLQLCCLFTLDSFAGSFVMQSIVSHWFHVKFNTPAATIGAMLFFCNLVAGVSALLAARIANYIGLILTMVVTHLPSNVFTILVAVMPTQATAMLLLFCRFSISQMDVPTRNAYVNGVVDPDERSAANGLTNVTRSVGAAFGPLCAGLLFAKYGGSCPYPFFICGVLKIVYDLLLLYNMQSVKPDSEKTPAESGSGGAQDGVVVQVVTFTALDRQRTEKADPDQDDDQEEMKDNDDNDVVEL